MYVYVHIWYTYVYYIIYVVIISIFLWPIVIYKTIKNKKNEYKNKAEHISCL